MGLFINSIENITRNGEYAGYEHIFICFENAFFHGVPQAQDCWLYAFIYRLYRLPI